MIHTVINPESLGAPKGYSNGILVPAGGRTLYIAGQVAWNREQKIVSRNFAKQFEKALENVVEVVRSAGGSPEHLVRLTIYVRSVTAYSRSRKEVGAGYRRIMGRQFPVMALVEVKRLLEPGAQVEIEATAVLP